MHTERTLTHTPVPPNPAVEPLAVSFLNSFFCYELDIFSFVVGFPLGVDFGQGSVTFKLAKLLSRNNTSI